MRIGGFVQRLLLAIALVYLGLTSLAAAQVTSGRAATTTNVNMRVGPGTSYPVVTVLRAGEQVMVSRCRATWCLVDFGRDRGWVAQSLLRPVISTGRPIPPIGGPIGGGGSIGFGRACFYEREHFRGRSFCLDQGESERNLGRWENHIGSIRVEGRFTEAEACTDRNFRNCNTFTRNVPILNFMLQQNVSSVRVR